ncbi:S-layer protein RsaA [Massilia terrae]|uniref:DUF4214 domain-containing protein n=1 Tax=Massilia terrae TaxID=1811224 RepID=A0ABT2CWQ3_9BURK|nr:DUF4214 domain-containing protein [Massilia terrae]MCS0658397.1 DUF4214 domain-containing protein [Massilia terrae]
MATYTAQIQALYVAYFNRPADAAGLSYWDGVITANKGSTAAVSAAFAASAEYKAAYAGMDAYHVIATVYQNLFGHQPDTPGLNYWGQLLLNGKITVDNAVTQIAAGAQGTDLKAYNDKVAAATAFTNGLTTTAQQLGYSGDYANQQAKGWMATIVDDATLAAAIDPAALAATITKVTTPVVPPVTFQLTGAIDTPVLTGGDDVILATSPDGTKNNLTTFDNIDGGAGVDTIRFADVATAATNQFNVIGPTVSANSVTVTNVEKVSVLTTGGVNFSTTGWTGVTDVNVAAAGTAADQITVSDTTNVTLTSAANTAVGGVGTYASDSVVVLGGKAVTITQSDATAKDVAVVGAGLTNVSITGGANVTVDNQDSKAVTAKGTTLTAVTLNGVTGTTASLSGASLTNVTLKNIAQADTVTINNATASHALNLTVDGAGKAATPVVVTVVDGVATTVNVTAAGASDIAINAAKATKVTIAGAAALTADVSNAGNTKLTTVDGSAATGALTLTTGSAVNSITTGTGNDVVTVTTATLKDDTTTTTVDETNNAVVSTGAGNDKVTVATTGTGATSVDTGAGNDTVTITTRGSGILTVTMGDGNDTFTSAVAINGTDVIDAGAGVDTLALSLVGSANIGAFSNFDVFDAKAMAKTLDVDILASKNTVTEFVASGDVGAGASLINVGANIGFRATGDMGNTDALTLTQKTAGALTVTLDVDQTDATLTNNNTADVVAANATSLTAVFDASSANTKVTNTETIILSSGTATTLTVVSGGSNAYNVLNYTDTGAKLTKVVASGASELDVTGSAFSKVTSLDASAMTGKLDVNLAKLAAHAATVSLGSGADTVTLTAAASDAVSASANTPAIDSLVGFAKASATAVSTTAAAADVTKAIAAADQIVFAGGSSVAANAADNGTFSVKNGVMTFSGTGPSTLAAAIVDADAATATLGKSAVVFEYLGNSYLFVQGDAVAGGVTANDAIVKLTGVTGVTNLGLGTTDHFFLV